MTTMLSLLLNFTQAIVVHSECISRTLKFKSLYTKSLCTEKVISFFKKFKKGALEFYVNKSLLQSK